MPCLSGSFSPSSGPLLQIAILGLETIPSAPPSPLRQPALFNALLDTGASATCISARVVREVGLKPTGRTQMTGSTGVKTVDQFGFIVGLVTNTQTPSAGVLTGKLNALPVLGSVFDNPGMGFDVLLGRDVLCQGQFSLGFDGRFVFCW